MTIELDAHATDDLRPRTRMRLAALTARVATFIVALLVSSLAVALPAQASPTLSIEPQTPSTGSTMRFDVWVIDDYGEKTPPSSVVAQMLHPTPGCSVSNTGGISLTIEPATACVVRFLAEGPGISFRSDVTVSRLSITFDENHGAAPIPTTVTGFDIGSTPAELGIVFPAPARTDFDFSGWNTAADGSGTTVTAGTGLTATPGITLYAQWTEHRVLTLTASTTTVAAGGSIDFTVLGQETGTVPTLSSSAPTDVITGFGIRFTTAGTRTITARLDGYTDASIAVSVTPGPATQVTVAPPEISADVISWGWRSSDEYGNPAVITPALFRIDGLCSLTRTTTGTEGVVQFEPPAVPGTCRGWFDGVSSPEFFAGLFSVHFDENHPAAPTPVTETRFGVATTLGGLGIPLPQPTRSGYRFLGWNTALDGRGTVFTDADLLTETPDLTVYAQWQEKVLALTPSDAPLTAGQSVDFTVTGHDAGTTPTLSSSNPTDTITGLTVRAVQAGTRTITATLDGHTSATAVLTVTAGAPATLILTSPAASVGRHGSLTFAVRGADGYGNLVDIDPDSVILTSSVRTDRIARLTVTFRDAGTHTITGALGELSSSVTVEVRRAAEPPFPKPPRGPRQLLVELLSWFTRG